MFYVAAWSILKRKIGKSHKIRDVQLESLCKANQLRLQNSSSQSKDSARARNIHFVKSGVFTSKKWLSRLAFAKSFQLSRENEKKRRSKNANRDKQSSMTVSAISNMQNDANAKRPLRKGGGADKK